MILVFLVLVIVQTFPAFYVAVFPIGLSFHVSQFVAEALLSSSTTICSVRQLGKSSAIFFMFSSTWLVVCILRCCMYLSPYLTTRLYTHLSAHLYTHLYTHLSAHLRVSDNYFETICQFPVFRDPTYCTNPKDFKTSRYRRIVALLLPINTCKSLVLVF